MTDRRRMLTESSHVSSDGEILDSWAQISSYCNANKAHLYYPVGSWKKLSCGSAGTVTERIIGFFVKQKAEEIGAANTLWVSDEVVSVFGIAGSNSEGDNVYALDRFYDNYFSSEVKPYLKTVYQLTGDTYQYDNRNYLSVTCEDRERKLFLVTKEEMSSGVEGYSMYSSRGFITKIVQPVLVNTSLGTASGRIKHPVGSASAVPWVCSISDDSNLRYCVHTSGEFTLGGALTGWNTSYVPVCFCL